MISKTYKKIISITLAILVFGSISNILYHIIYAIVDLSEKGWKPVIIYVILTLVIFFIIFIFTKKYLIKYLHSKDKQNHAELNATEKAIALKEKMVNYKSREKFINLEDHIIVPVYGSACAGKSTIIDYLINSSNNTKNDSIIIDLHETPKITDKIDNNIKILDKHKENNLSLYVISEDITSYEWDTIYRIVENGHYVIIILNKIDLLTETQRQEIEESVTQKIQEIKNFDRCSFVQIKASPKPLTVIIQKADGSEEESERAVEPECNALLETIKKYISKHSDKMRIKFVKTSR